MALADLLVDARYQVRTATADATVRRYVATLAAGVDMPPVKVGRIDGVLVLLDGFHRVAAYRQAGRSTIEAEIVTTTEREARWLAAQANMAHGLPLKREEQHGAFKAFVRAKRHEDHRGRLLPLRTAALAFGLGGHTTFLRRMQRFFPSIAARYGGVERDGGTARQLPSGAPGFRTIAADSLAQALAAARGVRDPVERGELVRAFRDATAEVEGGGDFRVLPEMF